MKNLGALLAIIGLIGIVLGLVNHYVKNFLGSAGHASTIIGIVGLVLLIIGVVIYMMPRRARA